MKYYEKFINKLESLLTPDDYDKLFNINYKGKKNIVAFKIKEIIEDEPQEFRDDVILNRDEYIKIVCCEWSKLYRPLTPQQKLIVLANIYQLYNYTDDGDRIYVPTNKILEVIDEGRVSEYHTGSVCRISNYMTDLPGLLSGDVLYWLQHEWRTLSGDWYSKVNGKSFISRRSNGFTVLHYKAFNEIFKQAYNRELKCADMFKDKSLYDKYGI